MNNQPSLVMNEDHLKLFPIASQESMDVIEAKLKDSTFKNEFVS